MVLWAFVSRRVGNVASLQGRQTLDRKPHFSTARRQRISSCTPVYFSVKTLVFLWTVGWHCPRNWMLGISALAPLTTCRANQVDNVFTSFHRSDQSFLILGAAFCLQPDPVTNCNNVRFSISKHHNTRMGCFKTRTFVNRSPPICALSPKLL